jgi:hypothetical protein
MGTFLLLRPNSPTTTEAQGKKEFATTCCDRDRQIRQNIKKKSPKVPLQESRTINDVRETIYKKSCVSKNT